MTLYLNPRTKINHFVPATKPTVMKKSALLLTITLIFVQQLVAQWSVIEGDDSKKEMPFYLTQKFTREAWNNSNFASEKDIKWFNEARYGMFIHFGLSTYVGKDLSWGVCSTRKAPDMGNGSYPYDEWTKWKDHFSLKDFDADEWVQIAQRAGMKYIVTIAKHHDGFHLWDTQFSDFKITNTPFGRDYLKEIADACHRAGMKFGIYYSQRDWYHPDYAPVDPSVIETQNDAPYYKVKKGEKLRPGKTHKKYIDYQFNAVRELCTRYGKIDVFWFDACWWGGMFTAEMWDSERLTRMIRQLQPGIIINNRASIPGDFDTPEQKIGLYQSRPWESCVTLSHTWSWSPTPTKSEKDIVKMLTATACGNGNMLMSWGPKWEGAFDTLQVKRLQEVGDWLKKYGHTLYFTKGGPWRPDTWGGSTYKGNKAFVHITDPLKKHLILPPIDNKIVKARCLTGGEISFTQTTKNVNVDISKAELGQNSIIVEFTFSEKIKKK